MVPLLTKKFLLLSFNLVEAFLSAILRFRSPKMLSLRSNGVGNISGARFLGDYPNGGEFGYVLVFRFCLVVGPACRESSSFWANI